MARNPYRPLVEIRIDAPVLVYYNGRLLLKQVDVKPIAWVVFECCWVLATTPEFGQRKMS